MARPLVNVPSRAKRGDIVEIKTLVQHPMETGFRAGLNGTLIARDIITTFTCAYNGVEVFRAGLSPAVAANPFLSFTTLAIESGTLTFTWAGDKGFAAVATAEIIVE